ncbi:RICIN domain-containing protein [Streptomyces sp. RKAG337]|uniref:RICIN domain-containing protein n=1 Tax=Streptomyces sp. RKAG337 TaxID=2893404 RepID=UPI0020344D15|nr:RICIN domain-containing protein [Streptomyces sp. RKAG337]MCM2424828.1 RICIN domain-containing protein [Streptomyces sp. RKAG337]
MSETEQDDAKRRQRARFVDALTSTAQQPGERSRLGIRVAGATAVLALVAGGTLGMGAWRSYQADADAKEQKLAFEQAAALKKIPQSPARPATPKPTKPAEPAQPTGRAEAPAPYAVPAAPPAKPSKEGKPQAEKKAAPRPMVLSDRSGVLLSNAATGMCADLPGTGPGQYQMMLIQSHCDGTGADNQQWNMQVHRGDTGPGGASLVLFVNAKDGLCIDVPERVPKPARTQIQEANCHSTVEDNELWWLDPVGDGTVRIRNYMSNQLCLAIWGDSPKTASWVWMDRCDADRDSLWRLI